MTTLLIWVVVIGVIALLTWAGINRRAKTQEANQRFIRCTGLNLLSITEVRHLQPLSVEGIYHYSSVLSYQLQSWAMFFFAATIALLAVLHLPFGRWCFVLALVPGTVMTISLIVSMNNIGRQWLLLDRSGRMDEGGGIRPPITPT